MQLEKIQTKIYEIREQKVMLDFDLAELYETETKYLKRAVKVNIKRFPPDFMFELTKLEYDSLRCNFSTLETTGRGKYAKYLPFAFTEQGVAMLSGILNSDKAIEVNISIMRAFVFVRQYALSHKDLTAKLQELENKYDKQFNDVYDAINFLLQKDNQETEQKLRKRIGYKNDETN
ncbi:MAG: ORF6N domain-containing protein [Bacteroidota bacterium]|nr:ORF6N domain-containing protein [Bacteroidota bacterium]